MPRGIFQSEHLLASYTPVKLGQQYRKCFQGFLRQSIGQNHACST